MIEYNKNNLEMVSKVITDNLTSDLLPKKWIERNKNNPMFGHCHTASACLQRIFGTKVLKLNRAVDDEGIWHWWCVDTDGYIIDLTQDQYLSENRKPPHTDGKRASMLGFGYRTKVLTLMDKVLIDLNSNGTPLM